MSIEDETEMPPHPPVTPPPPPEPFPPQPPPPELQEQPTDKGTIDNEQVDRALEALNQGTPLQGGE